MSTKPLELVLLPQILAVCSLPPDTMIPPWAMDTALWSVMRTPEELSVVCPQASVPRGVRQEGPWRVFQVLGPLDFGLTGILASLTAPLAAAKISIFALSTFDTDYLLVREETVDAARVSLAEAGFVIATASEG